MEELEENKMNLEIAKLEAMSARERFKLLNEPILVTNPIRRGIYFGTDSSKNYSNCKYNSVRVNRGVFGFSNDLGTDLAIASCVLF